MLKRIIKSQRGIIVSDAIIAILILILFSGIIISLITNIVLESKKLRINSTEMDVIADIFGYADGIAYDSINEDKLIQFINSRGRPYSSN